jgi:RNA-directed DNA polymerase
MSGQQLTEQLQLVFTSAEEDTPSSVVGGDAEPVVAKCEPERPAVTNSLMEAVCERENLKKALRRVKANKGSPGVDGMTVEQLPDYLRAHWPQHRDELLRGTRSKDAMRVSFARLLRSDWEFAVHTVDVDFAALRARLATPRPQHSRLTNAQQ